jgi:hypothetical protein
MSSHTAARTSHPHTNPLQPRAAADLLPKAQLGLQASSVTYRSVVLAAPHHVLPYVFELLDSHWLYEEVTRAVCDTPHDRAVLIVG